MVNNMVALSGTMKPVNTFQTMEKSRNNALAAQSMEQSIQGQKAQNLQKGLETIGTVAFSAMNGDLNGQVDPEKYKQGMSFLEGHGVDVSKYKDHPELAPMMAQMSLSTLQKLKMARSDKDAARLQKNFDTQMNMRAKEFAYKMRPSAPKPHSAVAKIQQDYKNGLITHKDYAAAIKKATTPRGPLVTMGGNKGEFEFQKKIAGKLADSLSSMFDEGTKAQDDTIVLDQLGELMPQNGGAWAGMQGWFAKQGIGGEGVGKLQAFNSLIDRMTPRMRQGLPGAASERDVAMFKNSLPSLWNSADGNDIILNTLSALNLVKIERGRIANQVMAGDMTRKQALKALNDLPDPLTTFKRWTKQRKTNGGQGVINQTIPQSQPVAPQPAPQIPQPMATAPPAAIQAAPGQPPRRKFNPATGALE